jgi:hypothetical protein
VAHGGRSAAPVRAENYPRNSIKIRKKKESVGKEKKVRGGIFYFRRGPRAVEAYSSWARR